MPHLRSWKVQQVGRRHQTVRETSASKLYAQWRAALDAHVRDGGADEMRLRGLGVAAFSSWKPRSWQWERRLRLGFKPVGLHGGLLDVEDFPFAAFLKQAERGTASCPTEFFGFLGLRIRSQSNGTSLRPSTVALVAWAFPLMWRSKCSSHGSHHRNEWEWCVIRDEQFASCADY